MDCFARLEPIAFSVIEIVAGNKETERLAFLDTSSSLHPLASEVCL